MVAMDTDAGGLVTLCWLPHGLCLAEKLARGAVLQKRAATTDVVVRGDSPAATVREVRLDQEGGEVYLGGGQNQRDTFAFWVTFV